MSIRCHVCGRLVDVPFRKAAIADAQAKREAENKRREAEAKRHRIARAEKMYYAGLQFDGAYRTSTPIILDTDLGETLSVRLHFKRDLTLDYECRLEQSGVEEDCGTTEYALLGESKVGFSFDAGCWETEWEGTPSAGQLRLSFCMEFYLGEGPGGPKAVVEGEAMLAFTPSAHNT